MTVGLTEDRAISDEKYKLLGKFKKNVKNFTLTNYIYDSSS